MEKENFLVNLAAGGISGIVAKTMGAPIERVKLLIQTQAINKNLVYIYKNPIDCVIRLYREEGILSFWRGNLANLYRFIPSQALNFALKDKFKALLLGPQSSHSNHFIVVAGNLIASGAAGGTALTITYPFDVARTRLAVDVGGGGSKVGRLYFGTVDCLLQLFRQEGLRGVYNGFAVSLFGAVMFRALFMGGYDITKYALDLQNKSILWRVVSAQVVTTVIGTACYPLDSVKRRLMIQTAGNKVQESSSTLYKNGWDCFVRIAREEGVVRGLFAGLSVNLVRGLSGPLLLVGYDELKRVIEVL
mmetsp:Transcript_21260/g.30448  ORF Transcript_21260/g.30448 Transcript_21260/m.30448 type:complete len:304 (+) Transcript_21260:122-1033(+)